MSRRLAAAGYRGPTEPCVYCNASGRMPVPPAYAAVLAVLGHQFQTSAVIATRLGRAAPKPTALCNRLAYLERAGLAVRRTSAANHRVVEWRIA